MAYFDITPQDSESDSDTADKSPTWGDYGHALMQGVYQGVGSVGSAIRYMGEQGKSDDAHAAVQMGRDIADVFNEFGNESADAMSPAMRDRLRSSVTDSSFWNHPFSAVAAKSTEMTGNMAPAIGAAAISSFTPAGPFVDTAILGATMGGMNAADSVDQLYKRTDALSDDELQKESKYYAGLRSSGVDEQTARADLNSEMLAYKPVYSFALGALGGVLGPLGIAARGGDIAAGVGTRALTGAAEAGLGSAVAAAPQEVQRQQEAMELGQQKEFDYSQLVKGVLDPATLGAVTGGAAAVGFGRAAEKPVEETEGVAPANRTGQVVAPTVEPATQAPPAASPKPEEVNQQPVTGVATSAQARPSESVSVGDTQNKPERSDVDYGKEAKSKGGPLPDATAMSPDQAEALDIAPKQPDIAQIAAMVEKGVTEPTPVTTESNAPAPVANPEVEQVLNQVAPKPKPRVLEDLKNKAAVAAQNKQVAQNIADMQKAEAGTPEVKPGHRTKAEKVLRAANENLAQAVFEKYAPQPNEDAPARLERAKAALAEFKDRGGKVPQRLRNTNSPGITFMREAQDLLRSSGKRNGVSPEQHTAFQAREYGLRAGDVEGVKEERRTGGATKVKPGATVENVAAAQPRVEAESEAIAPEAEAAPAEPTGARSEHEDMGAVVAPSKRGPVKLDENTEVIQEGPLKGEVRAKAASPVRKVEITPEMRALYERGPANFEDVAEPILKNGKSIMPLRSGTLAEALDAIKPVARSPIHGEIQKHMIKVLRKAVGDVPVHILSHEDVINYGTPTARRVGVYDPTNRRIVLSEHIVGARPELQAHAIVHEAIHAATLDELDRNGAAQRVVQALLDEVKNNAYEGLQSMYGFKDPREFLAEALSNPNFQEVLQQHVISPELAKKIGVTNWRKATVWDGLVHFVRKVLGLQPHETSALEAAMSLTERMMHDKMPDDARQYMANLRGAPKNAPEHQLADLIDDTGEIVDRVKGWFNQPNASEQMRAIGRAFVTNDQYANSPEVARILPDARKVFKTLQQQGVYAGKLKKDGDNLVRQLIRAYDKNPELFNQWAKLVNDQTMFGYDAGTPYGTGRNSHLAMSKKNAAAVANGTLDVGDLPFGHWEAFRNAPKLKADYDKIIAKDASYGKLQDDLFQFFNDAQHDMAKGHIKTYLQAGGIGDEATREARATDILAKVQDREALNKEFGGAIADQILKAKSVSGKEGVYAPLMRHGDHVVSGTYKVAAPANAVKQVAPDTWEFANRRDAEKFAHSTGLHYTARTVYYDPETGQRTTKIGGLSQAGTPEQRIEVRLQKQHTEFVPGRAEAEARQKELAKSGLFEKDPYIEKAVEWLRNEGEIGAGAQHTILNALKKTDEYRRATDAQKAEMERALNEAAMVTTAGNRIQSRRLPRRRVAGASEDLVKTMKIYNDSQANYRAKIQYRPQIDDQIAAMKQYVEGNRHRPDGTVDPDGYRRSVAFNEVERRARAQDPTEYTGMWPAATRKMLMLSYIDRMVRPSHLILHQTHLPMITVPQIAGRHGLMKSYGMALKTWKDAVGAYGAGVTDVKGSIADKLHEGTDYLTAMKQMFAKFPDGTRIARMFDDLAADNTIHPQSGLEGEKYVPSNQAGGLVGRADQTAARIDTVFRHATNATEAINRFVGAATAYRLEYARLVKEGMDKEAAHEAAVQYASKTVKDTQGYYTPTNAAPIFKNKLFKPFLQFKQFPQMIYHLLINNAKTALKGATREERLQAAKSLLYVLGTHTLMTGALGGIPTEPLKLLGMVTKGLGLTEGDWSDVERAEYDQAVQLLGKQGAEYAMHGVSRQLFGVDLHHRLGLNSFYTFGMPDQLDKKSISTFVLDQALGAPEGMMEDTFKGINEMMNGDVVKGALQAIPLQALRDVHRAWSGGTDYYKYGEGDAVKRVLGFTPAAEAAEGERAHEMKQELGEYKQERQDLMTQWQKASAEGKTAAWAAIQKWNAQQDKASQITLKQLQSAAKRTAAGDKAGYKYHGVSLNKQTQFIKKRDEETYAQ